MEVTRVKIADLDIFRTFDQERKLPEFIDIETADGNLNLLNDLPSLGLAIVGTRNPQSRSIHLLEKTFQELKGSNLVIISGFARGIDSHAHELAIQTGLRTLAVFGAGINVTYPEENRALRKKIIEHGGMIVSQFEKDTPPWPGNFTDRNRLIAGFAQATWIVEGAAISGTLNTATWAMRMNREIFATSCFPGDYYYQGNEKLLSMRNTHAWPIAWPFFNAESLSGLWPGLKKEEPPRKRSSRKPGQGTTLLQKWILELKQAYGKCEVQALMNYAYSQGQSLGAFYLEFEKNLSEGLIRQDVSGEVEVNL